MDHTLSEIRAFNATVRCGNFSRAADLIGVSQPAITAQIRKLESRFEFPLLERFSKGVRLTELGKNLYHITRQYEDLDDAIDVLVNPDKRPDEVTLRVASASTYVFMPLIARFRQRYPEVTLILKSATTAECKEMLKNRDVEIALCPMLDEVKGVSRLSFHSHPLISIVPPNNPLAAQDEISLYDLEKEPLIFARSHTCTQGVVNSYFARHNLKPNSPITIDNRQEICEAVAYDLGIGFAFENDIKPDSRICIKPIKEFESNVEEHVSWLKNRSFLPGIQDFVQLALEMKYEREEAEAPSDNQGEVLIG